MGLKASLAMAGAITMCAVAALTIGSGFGTKGNRPDVLDMLSVPQAVEQVHLYPRSKDQPFLEAIDYFRASNLGHRPLSRVVKSDGGVVTTYARADLTPEYVLEYLPAPTGEPKYLKAAKQYAHDGTLVADINFSVAGIRTSYGKRLDNGNYQTFTYFDDGATKESVKVTAKAGDADALTETHWLRDGRVASTSVMNDDNSRTEIKFDGQGLPILKSRFTRYGNGSTVSSFYPGTTQVRLESTTDYAKTSARWFRPDGTLERTAEITSGMITWVIYDADGKTVKLSQQWLFERAVENGVVYMKDLHIYEVIEPDSKGSARRTWTWLVINKTRNMWSYEEANHFWPPTPSVVCTSYRIYFNEDSGLGEKAVCSLPGKETKDLEMPFQPGDNVTAPPVPAWLLVQPKLEDNLPIPMPQQSFEH